MSSSFDWAKYENQPSAEQKFDWSKYEKPEKKQNPTTLKGSTQSYASGFAGGAGGGPKDVLNLLEPLRPFSPTIGALHNLAAVSDLKGTEEIAQSLYQEGPQNSLERILQKAGEFGGQEATIGTAVGGPVVGALGGVHGSISGTFYGAAKELGASDEVALLAALATLSPIAAERLIAKLSSNKAAAKSLSSEVKDTQKLVSKELGDVSNGPNVPPPPPPPGGIGPGTVLPETKSNFSEKEKIIEKLSEKPQGQPLGVELKVADVKAEAPSLQGRVSEARELGEAISKEPFETEAQAGRSIAREVKEARDTEKEIVRDKYKKAEEITQNHYDIYPELAKENEDRISKLEQLEKRSAGEEAVYQDALTLRRMIGEPGALIEANANRLMKQANSFSQKVNYELPYTGYKGQIKEIVHQMNNAVISSLDRAKLNSAAVKDADRTFARFADRFMGDEISPYLHKKILNPEELARTAVSDEASYKAIKGAISERTSPLINKIDRELLHKKMDKYYKNPELVNSKDYVKDLKNLSERIGKEKIAEVDLFLRQKQISHERNLLAQNKLRETQLAREKIASKQAPRPIKERITKEPIAKTPEQIDKLFKSRSDIRKFRRVMKDEGLEKEFEKLSEQKIEEIFKEGGFGSKKVTGKDLERIIDKEHEILSELLGEEEVSALYKAAKIAGKNELTQEILKQVAKTAGKMVLQFLGLGKLIKLLPINRV